MKFLLIIAVIWAHVWARKKGRLPQFLRPKPPHIAARNTALFGIAVTLVIFAVSVVQLGNDAQVIRAYSGMAYGNSETQMGIFFGVLFAFAIPAWGIFVYVMLPTLGRLMYKSIRGSLALNPGTRPSLAMLAGFGLISAVGFTSAWSKSKRLDSNTGEHYRLDKTQETIDPLYQCLWKLGSDEPGGPAFPDSLGATRVFDNVHTEGTSIRMTPYHRASSRSKPFTIAKARSVNRVFGLLKIV